MKKSGTGAGPGKWLESRFTPTPLYGQDGRDTEPELGMGRGRDCENFSNPKHSRGSVTSWGSC